jgi:hypothetical protein
MHDEFSIASASAASQAREVQPAASRLSFRSSLLLASTFSLNWAIWHTEWRADNLAFALALVTFVLLAIATVVRSGRALEPWINRLVLPLLVGAFAFFFHMVLSFAPSDAYFGPLLLTAATLVGLGLVRNPAVERWRIPLFLVVYAALGVWRIKATPAPHIDVWVWHNEALDALLHGRNPYAGSMPNIYEDAKFYDPSMVVDGRVLTGFQYPPVSLYFALPGYLLGDYRYSLLAGMLVAGACMAYTRPNGFGAIAMAVWLCCPRALFILEHGWTEPMLVMLVAVFLCCVVRAPKYAFIPLGLLIAGKQYMAIFLPLVWLLPTKDGVPRGNVGLVVRAVVAGGVVTLPFFLINPKAFFECMVLLQLRQPFRVESLSLVAWWFTQFGKRLPDWLGFASLLPTTALAFWRCERTPAGFATGLAFVSFVFFGLSKQAFGNYYFFTLGVICCAIAFASQDVRRPAG